jgi:hypothetical protein
MSYDYLLMRLARTVTSPAELDDASLAPLGTFEDVKRSLTGVLSAIRWDDAARVGALSVEHRWFEFAVFEPEPEVRCVSVRTSFRQDSTDVVEAICDRLGWIAVDGQAMRIYGLSAEAGPPGRGPGRWSDLR